MIRQGIDTRSILTAFQFLNRAGPPRKAYLNVTGEFAVRQVKTIRSLLNFDAGVRLIFTGVHLIFYGSPSIMMDNMIIKASANFSEKLLP